MEKSKQISILVAERVNDGIVIKFADGRCAFYPASLLYAAYPEAEELDETAVIW